MEYGKIKFKLKFPGYDLNHTTIIFKENITNPEILNLTDQEPEELWNEPKEVIKDEYQKTLPKMKK